MWAKYEYMVIPSFLFLLYRTVLLLRTAFEVGQGRLPLTLVFSSGFLSPVTAICTLSGLSLSCVIKHQCFLPLSPLNAYCSRAYELRTDFAISVSKLQLKVQNGIL